MRRRPQGDASSRRLLFATLTAFLVSFQLAVGYLDDQSIDGHNAATVNDPSQTSPFDDCDSGIAREASHHALVSGYTDWHILAASPLEATSLQERSPDRAAKPGVSVVIEFRGSMRADPTDGYERVVLHCTEFAGGVHVITVPQFLDALPPAEPLR